MKIEQLEALARAATEGRWVTDPSSKPDDKYTWALGPDGRPVFGTSGRALKDDVAFVAAARNHAKQILAVARALEGVIPFVDGSFEGGMKQIRKAREALRALEEAE